MNRAKIFLCITIILLTSVATVARKYLERNQANIYYCDSHSLCELSPYSTVHQGVLISAPSSPPYYFTGTTGFSCLGSCRNEIPPGTIIYFNP